MEKTDWSGEIISVQPRIRLNRSFDQRNHGYLGYSLKVDGYVGGEAKVFWVGVGKAAKDKYMLERGMRIEGKAHPVQDVRMETVDLYKVSALKVEQAGEAKPEDAPAGPPWHGVPPDLTVYRARGHRRLSAKTYQTHCIDCIWACNMPVVMTIDHWNPDQAEYRNETFCYGPKSCAVYKAGPTRKVKGRRGMVWEEEDWVDDDAVAHRSDDE